VSEAMSDVDSADMIEVAMEAKDADAAHEAEGAESAGAQGAARACRNAASACGFEVDLLKLLPLDAMPLDELRDLLRGFAEEHAQVALLAKVSAALLRGAGVTLDEAAVAAALELLDPFRDEAADAARKAHAALESAMGAHKATVDELAPVEAMAADFGASHEWHALHSNCFTARHGAFEYRLCPFDTFTQDGRRLGKYQGWVPRPRPADDGAPTDGHAFEMAFGDGEPCDGAPRKARVAFQCGEEDKLLRVEEPSVCEYAATFSTPSACSTAAVRVLHSELAAAAAAAGLPYEPDQAVKELLGL